MRMQVPNHDPRRARREADFAVLRLYRSLEAQTIAASVVRSTAWRPDEEAVDHRELVSLWLGWYAASHLPRCKRQRHPGTPEGTLVLYIAIPDSDQPPLDQVRLSGPWSEAAWSRAPALIWPRRSGSPRAAEPGGPRRTASDPADDLLLSSGSVCPARHARLGLRQLVRLSLPYRAWIARRRSPTLA